MRQTTSTSDLSDDRRRPPSAPTTGYVMMPNAVHEYRYQGKDAKLKRLTATEKETIELLLRHIGRGQIMVTLRQDTIGCEAGGLTDRAIRHRTNKPHMHQLVPRRVHRDRRGRVCYTIYDLSLVLAMLPVVTQKSLRIYDRLRQHLSARRSTQAIAEELAREDADASQNALETAPEAAVEGADHRKESAAISGTRNAVRDRQHSQPAAAGEAPDEKGGVGASRRSGIDEACHPVLAALTQTWPDGSSLSMSQALKARRTRTDQECLAQVEALPWRRPRRWAACLRDSLLSESKPWALPKALVRRRSASPEGQQRGDRDSGRPRAAAAPSEVQPPPAPPAADPVHVPVHAAVPSPRLAKAEIIVAECDPVQYRALLEETVERLRGTKSLAANHVRKHAALKNPSWHALSRHIRTLILRELEQTFELRRRRQNGGSA